MVLSLKKWPFCFLETSSLLFLDHRQNLICYLELLLLRQRWRRWIWSPAGQHELRRTWVLNVLYKDVRVKAERLEECKQGSFWPDLGSARARTFMRSTLMEQLHGCVICCSSSGQTHFLSGHLLACMSSGLKALYVFCRYETEPRTGSQKECLRKVHLSRSLISQKCGETLRFQNVLLLYLGLLHFCLLILPFDFDFFFFGRASSCPTVSWRRWLVGASVPVSILMCYIG